MTSVRVSITANEKVIASKEGGAAWLLLPVYHYFQDKTGCGSAIYTQPCAAIAKVC